MDTSPAPDRPLRRDAEANRLRIVAAAREVFAAQGLSAGLNDVARHAGVGVGTVYRRFPDKDALVEAAMHEQVEDMVALAREALGYPSAWHGLVHLVESVTRLNAVDRGLGELLFSRHGRHKVQEMRTRFFPVLHRLVERARQEGTLRPDVTLADLTVCQFLLGELARRSAAVSPDAYRRTVAVVLDGLRARDDLPQLPVAPFGDEEVAGIIGSWPARHGEDPAAR